MGRDGSEDQEEDEQEEEEGEDGHGSPPAIQEDIKEEDGGGSKSRDIGQKTDRQRAQEAEWGLYRSPQLSQNVDDDEEEETDDERRRETLKSNEEDYMVCPSTRERSLR